MATNAPGFFDYIPRLGYFAKGVVYALVGVLATLVALGGQGQIGGSRDGLQSLQGFPGSAFILGALSIGLFGYALWRLAQGIIDPEDENDADAPGVVARGRSIASGMVHIGLGAYAGKLALGVGSSGGSSWSGKVMQTEIGPYLIGAVGIAVALTGLYQFYKAYSGDFLDQLDTQKMTSSARDAVKKLGEAGHLARGVVFLIISWFLVDAAMTESSSQAASAGLGRALGTIASQQHGAIMLAAVAIGVAAYGAFCGVKGYYRRLAF